MLGFQVLMKMGSICIRREGERRISITGGSRNNGKGQKNIVDLDVFSRKIRLRGGTCGWEKSTTDDIQFSPYSGCLLSFVFQLLYSFAGYGRD